MTIKHATASTFVFARRGGGWRLGLVLHPIFGRLMIPGGHVEAHETPPEAARREVAEEAGLQVRFVPAPGAPLPAGLASCDRVVALPWWLMEQPIERDNHVAQRHYHLDHLYVAVADGGGTKAGPALPFGWHGPGELDGLDMFDDTRQLACALFADIDRFAAPLSGPASRAANPFTADDQVLGALRGAKSP